MTRSQALQTMQDEYDAYAAQLEEGAEHPFGERPTTISQEDFQRFINAVVGQGLRLPHIQIEGKKSQYIPPHRIIQVIVEELDSAILA